MCLSIGTSKIIIFLFVPKFRHIYSIYLPQRFPHPTCRSVVPEPLAVVVRISPVPQHVGPSELSPIFHAHKSLSQQQATGKQIYQNLIERLPEHLQPGDRVEYINH